MTQEQLELQISDFVEQSPLNYISEEEAMDVSLAGMRIYDTPIWGYADASDELFMELKKKEVVGPQLVVPSEWLKGAKTVISYFLPFTEAVRKSNREQGMPSKEWLHGRIEGQRFVAVLSQHIRELLEENGHQAVVPAADERFHCVMEPNGVFEEWKEASYTSNWSERHAAYISGLGTFGLSKGIITKRGMAGRLGSLITDADYEATERVYSDIYEYCTKCGACVRRCPVEAISLEHGKNHAICDTVMQKTKAQYKKYYGCGKCQTKVPCENQIPNPKFR